MTEHAEIKELKNFGLIVGGIFLVIGIWPFVWRGGDLRLWAVGLGAILVPLGLVAPAILRPVFRMWMKIGHILGWINTKIILGILFFGLITPMGMVMRLFGWDSMRRALVPDAKTYRVIRQPRPPSHMTRQF
jgi:hypothetical protein